MIKKVSLRRWPNMQALSMFLKMDITIVKSIECNPQENMRLFINE